MDGDLRVLLLSNDHAYSITPFRAMLQNHPAVSSEDTQRYVWRTEVKRGLAEGVNVIFLDPRAANDAQGADKFITHVRDCHPLVRFVLCGPTTVIEDFQREFPERSSYLKLDDRKVVQGEAHLLDDLLEFCHKELIAKREDRVTSFSEL